MQAPVEFRIEMSGDEIPLDLTPVHVTELLKTIESVGDYVPEGDGSQLASSLEVPWASAAVGRVLCRQYRWDDSAWTIEACGILATPVYYDCGAREAHLVKATREAPAADLDRYWRWLSELKWICHLLSTRRGVLHVCHTPLVDREGIVLAYTFEFSAQELMAFRGLLLELRKNYRIPKENQ